MNRRLKFILGALAALLGAAMLLRPYVAPGTGLFIAMSTWTVLGLVSLTAWADGWRRIHERNNNTLSRRAWITVGLQGAALITIFGGVAYAIGYVSYFGYLG